MKKFLVLIMSLTLFSVSLVCSCKTAEPKTVSDERKGDSYYQLGLAAWNQGDYIKAKREFSKAIESAPEVAHYYNHLGMVYLQDGDYEKAEENFKKSLKKDPKYSDTRNNLGVLYTKTGKYDNALEEFKNVGSDPLYPFPHYVETNIGIVYRLQKKYDLAEKHQNSALKMKGTHCEAYKELGIIYDEQGLHDKAANNFKKTLDYCPYYVEALYRGSLKMYMIKKEETGAAYLQRCLEIESKNIKEVTIPFLKDCIELAQKLGISSDIEKSGKKKQQIESD